MQGRALLLTKKETETETRRRLGRREVKDT